eukprot:3693095-Prymnesium_polylepis.1
MQLGRRTAHRAAQHAHRVGNVRPSLRGRVEKRVDQALVPLDKCRVRLVLGHERVAHQLREGAVGRRLVRRQRVGHALRQVLLHHLLDVRLLAQHDRSALTRDVDVEQVRDVALIVHLPGR